MKSLEQEVNKSELHLYPGLFHDVKEFFLTHRILTTAVVAYFGSGSLETKNQNVSMDGKHSSFVSVTRIPNFEGMKEPIIANRFYKMRGPKNWIPIICLLNHL